MTTFDVGDKVRVLEKNKSDYAYAATSQLAGKVGKVLEVNDDSVYVHFDHERLDCFNFYLGLDDVEKMDD